LFERFGGSDNSKVESVIGLSPQRQLNYTSGSGGYSSFALVGGFRGWEVNDEHNCRGKSDDNSFIVGCVNDVLHAPLHARELPKDGSIPKVSAHPSSHDKR